MHITIDDTIKEASQHQIALGIVSATVTVTEHDKTLWTLIQSVIEELLSQHKDTVTDFPEVNALRETYKQLGKSPSRYRGSNEALLRRLMQGKGLYQVNTVVDINNLLSISSRRSVGSYDCARLQGDIILRAGHANESYKGIGKDDINIENLPTLVDAQGPFGSPTSDSQRAMITPATKELMMVMFAFDGQSHIMDQLNQAAHWLHEFSHASELEVRVIE